MKRLSGIVKIVSEIYGGSLAGVVITFVVFGGLPTIGDLSPVVILECIAMCLILAGLITGLFYKIIGSALGYAGIVVFLLVENWVPGVPFFFLLLLIAVGLYCVSGLLSMYCDTIDEVL